MSKPRKFQAAYQAFIDRSLQSFGACLSEVNTATHCIEWRINKFTDTAHIIEFFENGTYDIYEFKSTSSK